MATERTKLERLKNRVMSAQEAVGFFENDMVVRASGFTKAGDSKVVLEAFSWYLRLAETGAMRKQ